MQIWQMFIKTPFDSDWKECNIGTIISPIKWYFKCEDISSHTPKQLNRHLGTRIKWNELQSNTDFNCVEGSTKDGFKFKLKLVGNNK